MSKKQKVFFGKLMSFSELIHDSEYINIICIDYDDEHDLISQHCAFMNFYYENHGKWTRFQKESNGWVYSVDSKKTILFHENWILDKTPEFKMPI